MSIDIGIIGLAKSGRTTIFNSLTRGEVDTERHTREGLAPHIGTAKIPEPRLKVLAEMLQPKKVVPASSTYIDVGASVKDLAQDKGIGGQLLNQLSTVDALLNVVRAFPDDSIPHIKGNLNIERDITDMNLELTFSDLTLLERRLERIEVSLKGAKSIERDSLLHEKGLLMKIKGDLEKDIPIREQTLTADEVKTLTGYQFLTAKPLLEVVNIGENQLSQTESLEAELNSHHSRPKCRVITLCGKLEMELAQLDNNAAEALRTEFGIKEAGIDRVIKLSYELLGLISFFTTASAEVKAWSIQDGTPAIKAAGKIHSDMERGFIRAEVISFNDLVKCGNLAEARKKGLLRLEGKNYIVKDGDVITFLFNV
ncbi:MAG: redox-regulated ATPase YchF [Dehalococcoidales bacterium]|nr:redox-regulated ATPase YchF [Dehalococcoidales bacterium]